MTKCYFTASRIYFLSCMVHVVPASSWQSVAFHQHQWISGIEWRCIASAACTCQISIWRAALYLEVLSDLVTAFLVWRLKVCFGIPMSLIVTHKESVSTICMMCKIVFLNNKNKKLQTKWWTRFKVTFLFLFVFFQLKTQSSNLFIYFAFPIQLL